jgi:hypothetical protein
MKWINSAITVANMRLVLFITIVTILGAGSTLCAEKQCSIVKAGKQVACSDVERAAMAKEMKEGIQGSEVFSQSRSLLEKQRRVLAMETASAKERLNTCLQRAQADRVIGSACEQEAGHK